jgi:SAM-dependent methyltransferase
MSGLEQTTQAHYATFGDRLAAALAVAKAKGGAVSPDDLAGFDQLHTGGAEATRGMIARLGARSGMHVLDVGCGLGGPARMLAAVTGARVTGIDLTPHFVAGAQQLTAATGQESLVDFRCGSALALPFADAAFDAAWHIHMSMNVEDKPRMYAEIFRVLKPGAHFCFHDPIRGARGEVVFPVPWAEQASASHLRTLQQMLAHLDDAGFAVLDVADETEDGLAWFAKIAAATAVASAEVKARSAAQADPRFAVMSKNHAANLASGAVAILAVCAQKPI